MGPSWRGGIEWEILHGLAAYVEILDVGHFAECDEDPQYFFRCEWLVELRMKGHPVIKLLCARGLQAVRLESAG